MILKRLLIFTQYSICINSLRMHMPIHSGEKTFSCKMCGTHMTYFSRYVLYMIYTAYVYKQINYILAQYYVYVETCRVHMPVHSGENPTLCTSCGIYNNYFNRYVYHNTSFNISYKHMSTHTSCTFCGIYNIYINRTDSYTTHSNVVSILYLCDCCVIYMFIFIVLVYYCRNYIIKSSSLILRL